MAITYNPKIDYLICLSICDSVPTASEIPNLIRAFNNEKAPGNYLQEQIATARMILNALKREQITNAYRYIASYFPNVMQEHQDIINDYFNNYDSSPEHFFNFFREIGDNYKFFMLVYNAKRFLENKVPIVFRKKDYSLLINYSGSIDFYTEDSDFGKLHRFCELKTEIINLSFDQPPVEQNVLLKMQNSTSIQKFTNLGVSSIHLYGSVYNQSSNPGQTSIYSDIDLAVFFGTNPSESVTKELIKYLWTLFGKKVDVTIGLESNASSFMELIGGELAQLF